MRPESSEPALIGCSHGTSDPAGRAVIHQLLADVRSARASVPVLEAFVDVQRPEVAEVVTSVVGPTGGGRNAVVVPLLLSSGYHVGVDIARAVTPTEPGTGADRVRAVAAPPLGPDPRLVDILADRLAAIEVRPHDAVVVAAAGSSRPGAARDVGRIAAALRLRHGGPVTVGYGAIAQPSVAEAVAAARAACGPGQRVVVAAYLLAPGYFYDRVREAGADALTAPLAPDPRLTQIVLDRYADGAAQVGEATPGRALRAVR